MHNILYYLNYPFSTEGTRTPDRTQKDTWGYSKKSVMTENIK
jgi:hypothetical protein